jgi:hypothetical protein
MRLLLADAKTGQQVNNRLGLDFQLSSEFVNAYLRCVTHTSLRIFLFLLFLRRMVFGGFSRRRVGLGGGFFATCLWVRLSSFV